MRNSVSSKCSPSNLPGFSFFEKIKTFDTEKAIIITKFLKLILFQNQSIWVHFLTELKKRFFRISTRNMNNAFETLCTEDETFKFFFFWWNLVRVMFCKSHRNAYKWLCSIYLDVGFEMLVKVFEGLILCLKAQNKLRGCCHRTGNSFTLFCRTSVKLYMPL